MNSSAVIDYGIYVESVLLSRFLRWRSGDDDLLCVIMYWLFTGTSNGVDQHTDWVALRSSWRQSPKTRLRRFSVVVDAVVTAVRRWCPSSSSASSAAERRPSWRHRFNDDLQTLGGKICTVIIIIIIIVNVV